MEIKLEIDDHKKSAFNLYEGEKKVGEMAILISGDTLTVYHTEVIPEANGKGYAKNLLEYMVAYVRENHLMVNALCPYVLAQFTKHPELYSDIWKKD